MSDRNYATKPDWTAWPLFAAQDLPHARATDPVTSHIAAASLSKLAANAAAVLAAYRNAGSRGLTAEEAGDITAIDGAWKRCSDLLTLGLIIDSGETRPSRANRAQRVLCVKEQTQ